MLRRMQGMPFCVAGMGDLLALFRCISCRFNFGTNVARPNTLGAPGRVFTSSEVRGPARCACLRAPLGMCLPLNWHKVGAASITRGKLLPGVPLSGWGAALPWGAKRDGLSTGGC